MKKRFLSTIQCLLIAMLIHAQNIDVIHYNYEIELSDKNDTIYGKATIIFKMKKQGPVSFDLIGVGKNGKGMKVYEVGTSESATGIKYSQQDDKLTFPNGFLSKSDSIVLFVHYKGIPADG